MDEYKNRPSWTLRPRSHSSTRTDSESHPSESAFSVGSASKWTQYTTRYLNIKVTDVDELFPGQEDLCDKANKLIIPEWTEGEWLKHVDLKKASYDNDIKTLIGKIRKVFLSEERSVLEVIVDGFMQSLLSILCFDEYPCSFYPQYEYKAIIGEKNHSVNAKPDFSVFSEKDKIMLVIEDKVVTSATYANNWKEDQVMAELFAAVHYAVRNSRQSTVLTYPIIVCAVRVIGTKFTFYKASATLDYIKETARRGMALETNMVVQRYPLVEDDPSRLTAYDICNNSDRMRILRCLCSIRKWICN